MTCKAQDASLKTMAQKDFPVNDLASGLKDLQNSLAKAESACSQDKELSQAVQDAKKAADKVEHNLKSTYRNS